MTYEIGATLVCDGFEHGSLASDTIPYYDKQNTALTSISMHGDHAVRVTPVNDYGWLRVGNLNNGTYLTDAITPAAGNSWTDVGIDVWSLYFKFNVLPDTNCSVFFGTERPGSVFEGSMGLSFNSSTGCIRSFARSFDGDTLEYGDDGTEIVVGRWYLLDMQLDQANKLVDWRIDNRDQPEGDFNGIVNVGLLAMQVIGNYDNSAIANPAVTEPTTSMDLLVDDWLVVRDLGSDVYPIGQHEVSLLYPAAAGTNNNPTHFTDDDGNSAPTTPWKRIDDVNPEAASDTDFFKQTTANAASYMEFQFSGLPRNARGPVFGCLGYIGNEATSQTHNVLSKLIIGGQTRWMTASVSFAEPAASGKGWITGNPLVGYTSSTPINDINEAKVRIGFLSNITSDIEYHTARLNVAHRVNDEPESLFIHELKTGGDA